jgi:hypothetical protein
MRDAENVITDAVNGHTAELAKIFEVSEPRMYQLLSTHCSYPKAKLLIRAIGKVNPAGARLIKADMDALFADILEVSETVTEIDLHREAFEAVQACMQCKSRADRGKELRELISVAQAMLVSMDAPNVREFARDAVADRRAKP